MANARKKVRKVEMGSSTREVELATIEISDINKQFAIPVEVTKLDKGELLFVDNPNYREMVASYSHLYGVVIDDLDRKDRLPTGTHHSRSR